MDAVPEKLKEMNVQIQNLYYTYLNSKGPEILEEKRKQLNEKVEEYKKTFMTKENAIQRLIDMQRRLNILSVPTLPMQYDRTELEQLQKEIEQLSCFLWVDPDARDIQLEDISYLLRVTKFGEKWEDKDKIIQTRNDTITELEEQLNDRNRLIHLFQQKFYEGCQNGCLANPDKQMILKLQQEAETREREPNSLRVKLEQTKTAEKERNQVTNIVNVSVVNHFHNSNTLNNSAHAIPIQVGDQNMLNNSPYNTMFNPVQKEH